MRALLTGGTGFVGAALTASLLHDGWHLVVLSRQQLSDTDKVRYISALDEIDSATVFDAVINLAGASLAGQRWSAAYKREIVSSRITQTDNLVALIARMDRPPEVLLSASAIGYYGHHLDECVTEDSAPAAGFSQKLCHDWEAAALRAEAFGTRVCLMRLGVVLDNGGGALQEMRRSFQLGVASWAGSGSQWLSWVHRQDVVNAIRWLQADDSLQGPFNLTAPMPVTARNFGLALKKQYTTLFSVGVPGIVMKMALGEMAEELLLNGQRVIPTRLQDTGFKFEYPNVETALAKIYA